MLWTGYRWLRIGTPAELRPSEMIHNGYVGHGPRCEPPGEAYARGWKACQEAAIGTLGRIEPDYETAGCYDVTWDDFVQVARHAIRSLTPPKDAP